MTITYAGRFEKLVFRWKASLWKSIWKELLVYLIIFYSINMIYRYALSDEHRKLFAKVALKLDRIASSDIPISFMLGLFVVTIVKRWWEQFENIGWPDDLLFLVSAYVRGPDERSTNTDERNERTNYLRKVRRNMARYTVLAAVLAWRNISSRVLKRFPTYAHLVRSGLMTKEEQELYQATPAPFGRWFMPLNWVQTMILHCREDGILDTPQCTQLMSELHNYRRKFIRLFVCDWISIPLVYTQVCTVATYGYFAMCLIGRQCLMEKDFPSNFDNNVTIYFPVHTVIQFLLYMGWLKVAEKIMHPFGEEDDDFELNYILDRHLYVGYMIVDNLCYQKPLDIMQDDPFQTKEPILPHTKASYRTKDHQPSAINPQAKTLLFDEMALWRKKSFDQNDDLDSAGVAVPKNFMTRCIGGIRKM